MEWGPQNSGSDMTGPLQTVAGFRVSSHSPAGDLGDRSTWVFPLLLLLSHDSDRVSASFVYSHFPLLC